MFKKYKMTWNEEDGKERSCDFFVNSKRTRQGFLHRACVVGPLPRLDERDTDWSTYRANEDKLFSKRTLKVSYINRTWEYWSGQTCLSRLWEQLTKLKFVDMSRISKENPFGSYVEPEHEDLPEPDELFRGFRRIQW